MLTEADESIGQCKKTAGKFSLHLRILQNWIPQVFSVSIPHQHAFFKNTPLLCLEWISVTWSWLPTFPLPDCKVQALPGAGGRESWTPGSAASSIHWETLVGTRFLKDTSETCPHPFLLPGKAAAAAWTPWASPPPAVEADSRAGGAPGQLAINLKQIL